LTLVHLCKWALVGVCCLLLRAAAAAPPLSLAVLPFGNLSEYRGRLLDQRAAAAVAAAAPAPWQALAAPAVEQALEGLGAPWPLETADVQRLCAQVQAGAAVTGAIKTVQVEDQGAQVTIFVEVVEPLSGETIGRASGVGKFATHDALPVDERVDQALQRAAQAAWTALGPPPSLVGEVTGPAVGDRLPLKLRAPARLPDRAVLLLFAPDGAPVGPPLAAVVVQTVADETAQVGVLARRAETPAGAQAVLVGRLP
jgi:hypothetical protein